MVSYGEKKLMVEEDIEQKAIKTYHHNLLYFKEHHTNTYTKLSLLEQAIELGQYKENYSLEYIDDKYFDVQELASKEFLYAVNSLEYSKKLVTTVDTKKTGGVFQAVKYVDFSPDMVEKIDKSKLTFHNSLWATIKIIDYVRKFSRAQNTSMINVYKTIFLDIGLGLHIKSIIDKLHSLVVYISEPNLELFRLSLFVTDYEKLSQNKTLYFSIAENESQQRESFTNFLEFGNNYNMFIKHVPFRKNYESQLKKLQTFVLSQSHIMYGYSGLLLRTIDSIRYLPKGYSFINVNKTYIHSIFSKKPVLLLFSGPSSSKHLKWILANRDKFILITALSTCRLLNKYKLTPDVVVHIDPGANETLALFEGIDTKTFFKQTICIFSSNVDKSTVNKFDKKRVYFIEQGTNYKKDFGNFTSPSVGEYTYTIFLLFGATNMFILGLDLALDPDTLQTHGEAHPFNSKGVENNNSSDYSYKTAIEYTKGNFLEKVPTLTLYKISIGEFQRFTKMLKRTDHQVFNLGNGAYLEGAIPLKINDYDWSQFKKLNRKKIDKEINNFFNSVSSSNFSMDDKMLVQYQINEAKKLKDMIEIFSKEALNDSSSYLEQLSKLSWNMSDMQKTTHSDLAEVYYEYFKTILSYIFDLFNTKELIDLETRVQELHTILVEQMLKISNLYIKTLEDGIK